MYKLLKGKKLLYLGGIKRAEYVVKRAKQLGIYVIVADYNEDSPAKKVADEGLLVDAMNVDDIVNVCVEKNVDGIMTGYADILMPVCYEVCKRTGLNCYFTESMLKASTDKEYFKKICFENNVPVPKTYQVFKDNIDEFEGTIDYPVFIKPIDASGSRGADVCWNAKELKSKYELASSFSKKGNVTVEDFLSGTEFILDYLIIDGIPYLLSMADRYTQDNSRVAINSPNLMILPSKNLSSYLKYVNENVCHMFKKCNFKNGLIFLQGYAKGEKITFYEMGCRLGGTWPYIDEYFTGFNPLDLLFRHALDGTMIESDIDVRHRLNPCFKGYAGIIYFLSNCENGRINKIRGIRELNDIDGVVDVMQFYEEGETFELGSQTDIRFLSVHLVAGNFIELEQRINQVYDVVDFLDDENNSLVATHYDFKLLNGYKE